MAKLAGGMLIRFSATDGFMFVPAKVIANGGLLVVGWLESTYVDCPLPVYPRTERVLSAICGNANGGNRRVKCNSFRSGPDATVRKNRGCENKSLGSTDFEIYIVENGESKKGYRWSRPKELLRVFGRQIYFVI